MKFVLSKLKESLLAMNLLFRIINIWFGDSTRWLISASAIIILPSSANRKGVETELIFRGRSLIYKIKRSGQRIEP
jgi:hypothetical protein